MQFKRIDQMRKLHSDESIPLLGPRIARNADVLFEVLIGIEMFVMNRPSNLIKPLNRYANNFLITGWPAPPRKMYFAKFLISIRPCVAFDV